MNDIGAVAIKIAAVVETFLSGRKGLGFSDLEEDILLEVRGGMAEEIGQVLVDIITLNARRWQ